MVVPVRDWWDLFDSENSRHDSVDPVYVSETIRHAVLRTCGISDAEVPINALRSALRCRGEGLLHVRPPVLENPVVFRDYFPNCVVWVCGTRRGSWHRSDSRGVRPDNRGSGRAALSTHAVERVMAGS